MFDTMSHILLDLICTCAVVCKNFLVSHTPLGEVQWIEIKATWGPLLIKAIARRRVWKSSDKH